MKSIIFAAICFVTIISCKTTDAIMLGDVGGSNQLERDVPQLNTERFDRIVESAMDSLKGIAGFALGVVKDGSVIHAKGYGVKSIETNEKVTKDTPFAIASNTKAFTTTALAILVDRKKLKWTDKVVQFIPEFKMYNEYVTNNFTIADLLTHRSGLGLGAGDLMFFPDGSDFTMKDVLTCFQYFEPSSDFRTQFDYDNLLYLVAGEVVARVSNMQWNTFVKEEIIAPLQMHNSYSDINSVDNVDVLAQPHAFHETLTPIDHMQINAGVNGADGSILSSASDMCKWMLAQLNHGNYGAELEKELFSQEQQNEMWRIHTTIKKRPNSRYRSHFSGYGLGWFLSDVLGNMKVEHQGMGPGMVSEVVLIPDIDLGIVVMSNSTESTLLNAVVSRTIMDEFIGAEDYDWLKRAMDIQNRAKRDDLFTKEVWGQVEKNKKMAFLEERYIGIYEDPWFGKIEIFNNNGNLWFKSYRSPKLNGRMYFYDENVFAIKWEYQDMNADAFATFKVDESGQAQSITMKGISDNIDFSFDFQDLRLRRIESDSYGVPNED